MPDDNLVSTIGVTRETFTLVEAIAKKRSEELGFRVSKAAVVRNLVAHEAREMGLYGSKKRKKV